MQDPTAFSAMRQEQDAPQFPEQEQHLKCPRCDSTNTKFCYYNNYNLSQPRHFCKSCRRYWTKGGALRNIPVGGGTRKNSKRSTTDNTNVVTNPTKRSSLSTNPASPTPSQMPKFESLVPSLPQLFPISGERRIESFGSLLNPNGDHGSLVGNFHHDGDGASSHSVVLSIPNSSIVNNNNNNNNYGLESSSSLPYNPPSAPPPLENYWNNTGFDGGGGRSGSSGGDGWPDLSI